MVVGLGTAPVRRYCVCVWGGGGGVGVYLIGSPYSSQVGFSSRHGNMGNDLVCLKNELRAFA